jgi:hypothetical protein
MDIFEDDILHRNYIIRDLFEHGVIVLGAKKHDSQMSRNIAGDCFNIGKKLVLIQHLTGIFDDVESINTVVVQERNVFATID